MNPSLQIKLFGSPQITYLGQPLNGFVSVKVRGLLIYLAAIARPHSRDHLAHLLWEDTPASMKVNLRKALSNLRQLIGEVLVEDGKELVSLDMRRCWVDVGEFERLRKTPPPNLPQTRGGTGNEETTLSEAIELYQADFLSGFNPSLSYEFESWVLSEQSRLKSLMVDRLRQLATQQEKGNRLSDAIQSVRRLLELEPWQEESHRWLMTLLAKDGQRSAALAHFEVCKKVLREELDVVPSAETLQLVTQIQHSAHTPTKPSAKPTSIPKPEFPLVGREEELQIIQSAWQHSLRNGPHFVCIAGEAGIGKTRLTEEARIWVAEQGYASVYARSYAAEGALAYSPVVDWLRSEAIRPALEQLDVVWLNEVARLLPELLSEYPNLSQPKPITDGWQRRQFFEALARAITISGQPMLLIIDDLQWCDRETLEWLRFLLRFDSKQPILIIGAYRIEEVDQSHPLQKLLLELRRHELVAEIELGMLNVAETTRLINIVTPEQTSYVQMAEWWKMTAGHPLFVIESIRNKGTKQQGFLPRKVQTVIQTRLLNLSPDARFLATVAATIGHAFSLELLAKASQFDTEKSLQLLDELWTRRVVQSPNYGNYDFSHDRIREVVYADIPPIKRQTLHQRIAQTLENIYQPNLDPIIGELAVHYEQAGMLEMAMRCNKRAAIKARQFYAHAELVHYFTKTLSMLQQLPNRASLASEEIDLLLDLGLAYIFTHGWGSQPIGEAWHKAYDLALQKGTRFQQCRAMLGLDTYFNNQGKIQDAHIYSERNFILAQEETDIFLKQQVLTNYGAILYHLGKIDKSLPYFEEMLAIHKLGLEPSFVWIHRDVSTNALVRSAKSLWFLGYADQARARCDKAMELARHDFDLFTLTAALDFSGMVYSFCQDYGSVKRLGEELVAVSTKYDFPYYNLIGKIYVDWASVQLGDVNGVQKVIEAVSDLFTKTSTRKFAPQRTAMSAEALIKTGKPVEALSEIEQILQRTQVSGNIYFDAHLLKLKGDCYQTLGKDQSSVETVYYQSLTFARQQGAKALELRAVYHLARLWQTQGKTAEAHQLLAPIYNWFSEGFDTPDLIEAKRLLNELEHHLHPTQLIHSQLQ